MKIKFFGKFRNIARRVLVLVLCLVVVFQAFGVTAFAGIEETYQGYTWTRIHNEEELRAYVEAAKTDRENEGRHLIAGDQNIGSEDQWFKALIAYKTNDVTYFMSGSSFSNDGEKFSSSKVIPRYNMPIGEEDQFTTVSGYFAPYIKYAGNDPDNGNAAKFYVRFSKNDSDDLGDDVLVCNASWYGIKYAAAMYGQFRKTNNDNVTSHDYGAACNSTAEKCFTTQWLSNGCFRAYYNIHGVADRWWCYNDKNYDIEVAKSPDVGKSQFYLYIGVPAEISKIDTEVTVSPAYTTTYDSAIITEEGSIVIPKNATVVVQGHCFNNGNIYVEGGTLIIKGTLDTSVATSTGDDVVMPSVSVSDGGCVFIEETGLLIARSLLFKLDLTEASTMVVSGSAIVPGAVNIDNSSLMVREGAALIVGIVPKEEVDSQSFGREFIKANRFASLATYFSEPDPQVAALVKLIKTSLVGDGVTVKNNGMLLSHGLFFCKQDLVTDTNYPAVDALRAFNLNEMVNRIMRSW